MPDSNSDVEPFERWADKYDASPLQRLYFTPVHTAMLDLLPSADATRDMVIVDVGCGTGRLLRAASRRWPRAELLGVDPAVQMVNHARRLTPQATFQVGSAETLQLPDESADIVLSSVSFHHWTNQFLGLREIARILRSGGRLCLADHMMPAPVARLLRSRSRSRSSVISLIRDVGLTPEQPVRLWARFVTVIAARKSLSSLADATTPS